MKIARSERNLCYSSYLFVQAVMSTPPKEGLVMSKVCEICGKHPVAGRSISHSHRVTNRQFRPNIQRVYCVVDGHRRKMNVCTTCLKSGKVARS